ncbi:alpha-ketoacid dehydrogenase subunit beta [Seongchinamella unica]|uniref:2-oxoisovalerate dehydrogenase subunit beta n=1 Tax=Seongchinamella unica TaxID=2547392 RepID=A0A4R5LR33_9GAMM|nr:alpha-ketoacid dehydrogenase subunit beta [Seongchinamella unica]TDG13335.1 alpha-ketoacid dehydrogenase subunit beta [Seongchinamella unica]
MPEKTMRDAINEALHQEMAVDDTVFVIGEDVAGGNGSDGTVGCAGGVFGVTAGLYEKFGPLRCIDTPISESAIVGAAAGAALVGMRPVAEIMFSDFIGVCMDQIVNQMAKFRYMFGGKTRCPAVIRFACGAGFSAAAQHSQTMYQMMTAVPGLKVVIPSNAYDAKGLLLSAIRDDDPVLFFEPKALYQEACEVPDEPYTIPFGEAAMPREGDDVTVVAFGQMVGRAMAAIDGLEAQGISCDLVDPRTTSPLDSETILESVAATGRLVVVDESPPRCGLTADIAAMVSEKAFRSLQAPVKQVCAPHTPVPFSPDLEAEYVPSIDKIQAAIRETLQ